MIANYGHSTRISGWEWHEMTNTTAGLAEVDQAGKKISNSGIVDANGPFQGALPADRAARVDGGGRRYDSKGHVGEGEDQRPDSQSDQEERYRHQADCTQHQPPALRHFSVVDR